MAITSILHKIVDLTAVRGSPRRSVTYIQTEEKLYGRAHIRRLRK